MAQGRNQVQKGYPSLSKKGRKIEERRKKEGGKGVEDGEKGPLVFEKGECGGIMNGLFFFSHFDILHRGCCLFLFFSCDFSCLVPFTLDYDCFASVYHPFFCFCLTFWSGGKGEFELLLFGAISLLCCSVK